MEPKDSDVEGVENWDDIIAGGDVKKIQDRLQRDLKGLMRTWKRCLRGYSVVILYKRGRIDSTDTDKLFQALQEIDPNKRNNVLLIIESGAGDPKSGYQISKLCREWAADKFMVAVPRHAKSAATMIALGADQVHMGLLSELGPVDPQVLGVPMLAIQDSIETITQCVNDNPGESGAKMWAEYLSSQFRFDQLGRNQRVVESIVQYAERLLVAGKSDRPRANEIANRLVHDYKDHGFVIDSEEAIEIFGEASVVVSSNELSFSEEVYRVIRNVEIGLRGPDPYRNAISPSIDPWSHTARVKAVGALDNCVSVIPPRRPTPPREFENEPESDYGL